MKLKTLSLLAAGSIGLAAFPVIAQQVGGSNFDRWWKPELDAVTAAPNNHKVLFENDEVRVLEVTIAPHTRRWKQGQAPSGSDILSLALR